MSRSLPTPALVLAASLALPPAAFAGLNEGEVRVASALETESTFYADDFLSLNLTKSSGSANISGDMESFNLNTGAWMSDTPLRLAAASSAAVDFYDNITLNVPGLLPETPVRIRMAWSVDAGASSSGSSQVMTSARAVVAGPGTQVWTRESNNFGDPETWDPAGRVEFDFIVKAGTPEPGNIKLTAAAESVAFLDSQDIPDNYNANPASDLSVQFLEVVSAEIVSTGLELPIWTIQSLSLFDYGSGNGQVTTPTTPTLSIAVSGFEPELISLSWMSSPYELYTIESSPDLNTWTPETQVNGNGSTVTLEFTKSDERRYYRLVTQIGTAS